MSNRLIRLMSACAFVGCAAAFAPAQTAPAEPTSQQADAVEAMKVVIVSVTGTVRVRANADSPWVPATVDMVVGEDAEFRTGPRSSVTCVIPPDQTFTLDRLGTMSVLEAIKEGSTVRTDLALKYGRVKYDIQAAGVEHRAVIRSPSSTLAVRGTEVQLYDQPPYTVEAQSFTGRAMFGYAKRIVPVGNKSLAKVSAGKSGAAETAMDASVVDPAFGLARTETENQLIANETSRGAVLTFDPVANIDVITGGAGPLPDAAFANNAPGNLNFFLRWTSNADLNLTVTLQPGDGETILFSGNFQPTEILYPGYSLDRTPSGGRIAFDHRGGENGGTETGYWQNVVPGLYGISARNISGETTDFKFNVDQQGTPITIYTEELTKTKQLERSLAPGGEIVGIVLVPGSELLESIFPDDTGPVLQSIQRVNRAPKSIAGPKIQAGRGGLIVGPGLTAPTNVKGKR